MKPIATTPVGPGRRRRGSRPRLPLAASVSTDERPLSGYSELPVIVCLPNARRVHGWAQVQTTPNGASEQHPFVQRAAVALKRGHEPHFRKAYPVLVVD
jgi:hypothetical protein